MGVAVFDSEASYRKNADDPEQDRTLVPAAAGALWKRTQR